MSKLGKFMAIALLASLPFAGAADAFSLSFGYAPAPVYYAPPVVYSPPPVAYMPPAPYAVPAPVVYAAPVPVYTTVYPSYSFGYRDGYHHHHHYWR